MRRHFALFSAAICLSATLVLPVPCIAQAGSLAVGAGQALALAGALEAVKPGLDESVNNAGNQADQTLRNAQTRADYLIKQLRDLSTKVGADFATQREQAASQAFALLGQLYAETQQTRMNVSISMFQGLAAASAMLDAIPFVHVPDTPFAALPVALKPSSSDRRVVIYGYFPSLRNGDATVKFDSGKKVNGIRGIGSLYFDVPQELVKEGSFVNTTVSLPSGSWFTRDYTFGSRVFVLPRKPFHVTVDRLQRKDASYRDIPGTAQILRADSGNQSVHWVQNAKSLFMSCVASHADYDADDVVFKDVQIVQTSIDKPEGMGSCCNSPSFVLHSKTLDQVDLSLSAPNCDCGPFYHRVTGGSHIDYSITPIFTARLAHEGKSQPLDEKTFDMSENDVQKIPPDPRAVMTQVLIEVSDGQSSAKDFAEISNGNVNQTAATAAAKRTWDVSLASDGTVVITTRNLPVTFVGQ
jgi:hypothetical protein